MTMLIFRSSSSLLARIVALCWLNCCALLLTAQTATGVYDSWEASPFRTGLLQGNVALIANPHPDAQVGNEQVVALQRSRYGSNTFGACLRLETPFLLTPQETFVHFDLYSPIPGRAMIIALGSRLDRPGQNLNTEQAWAITPQALAPHRWHHLALPIKGNGGIRIHSIVVVPHAESPHALRADFAAYIAGLRISSAAELEGALAVPTDTAAFDHAHCLITNTNRNGRVTTATGHELIGLRHPLGQPLRIRLMPEAGFKQGGFLLRTGRHLQGAQRVGNTVRWTQRQIEASQIDTEGYFTLPAEWLSAPEAEIEGLFLEKR